MQPGSEVSLSSPARRANSLTIDQLRMVLLFLAAFRLFASKRMVNEKGLTQLLAHCGFALQQLSRQALGRAMPSSLSPPGKVSEHSTSDLHPIVVIYVNVEPLSFISKPDWLCRLFARFGLSREEKATARPSPTQCVPDPIRYPHPVSTGSPQNDNSVPALCLQDWGTSSLRCDE